MTGGGRVAVLAARPESGRTNGAGLFPVVVHLLVVSDRRLVMLRERSGGWVFPSGLVGDGAGLPLAARRVAGARLGVRVETAGVRVVHTQFDRSAGGVLSLFVQAPRTTGVPFLADRARYDQIGWHAPGCLPARTPPSLVSAVTSWGHGGTYSEFPSVSPLDDGGGDVPCIR